MFQIGAGVRRPSPGTVGRWLTSPDVGRRLPGPLGSSRSLEREIVNDPVRRLKVGTARADEPVRRSRHSHAGGWGAGGQGDVEHRGESVGRPAGRRWMVVPFDREYGGTDK